MGDPTIRTTKKRAKLLNNRRHAQRTQVADKTTGLEAVRAVFQDHPFEGCRAIGDRRKAMFAGAATRLPAGRARPRIFAIQIMAFIADPYITDGTVDETSLKLRPDRLVLQEIGRPSRFLLLENWTDEGAYKAHEKAARQREFRNASWRSRSRQAHLARAARRL
jgi:hypothetical protein